MNSNIISYSGLHGQRYTLNKRLGSGGEGDVYSLSNNSIQVAKIFQKHKPGREDKLKAIIKLKIPSRINGYVRLAIPEDILYDENSRIVGYVMPFVDDTLQLFNVWRENDSDREKAFPNYGWKHGVVIAYNFAELIEFLHQKGVVIGDFNPNNFVVDAVNGGRAVIIDCDSFDVKDPVTGRHFPCEVFFKEVAAPELQSVVNVADAIFTEESDNFSLAIHIFRLLMNNMDPFGSVNVGTKQPSSFMVGGGIEAIIKGECPYVKNIPDKSVPPLSLPFDFLPSEIQALFKRVFNYSESNNIRTSVIKNRPTAGEWAKALLKYAQNDQYVITCTANPRHKYPSHNTFCPWCDLEKKKANSNNAGNASSNNSKSSNNTNNKNKSNSNAQNTIGRSGSTGYTHIKHYSYSQHRNIIVYWVLYILIGLLSGFLGPVFFKLYGLSFSYWVTFSIFSVVGVIYAVCMADLTQDNYEYSTTKEYYLFLLSTLSALIAPIIVTAIIVYVIKLIVFLLASLLNIVLSALSYLGSLALSALVSFGDWVFSGIAHIWKPILTVFVVLSILSAVCRSCCCCQDD